jgi:hypothetical protein
MEAPDEFRCPITMEVMTDPVIGDDGHTYERAAITRALQTNSVSPMTRQRMTVTGLRPNFALRSTIQRWKSGAPKPSAPSAAPTPSAAPKPSAATTHTHTEYILLITPEVQSEQERLFNKRPVVASTAATATTTAATSVTLDEHRRRMCRVSIILCLLVVVLIFVFHAMSS